MFAKTSRYRKLSDVVTADAKGRISGSKGLRPPAEAPGALVHIIEAGDRLDLLAHRYYRQPGKWWRICDANPEFLSPLDLLGTGPLVTLRIPLAVPAAGLVGLLSGAVGIDSVQVRHETRLVAEEQSMDGEHTTMYRHELSYALIVMYNRLNIALEAVLKLIEDALKALAAEGTAAPSAVIGRPQTISRTGKRLAIPRDVIA